MSKLHIDYCIWCSWSRWQPARCEGHILRSAYWLVHKCPPPLWPATTAVMHLATPVYPVSWEVGCAFSLELASNMQLSVSLFQPFLLNAVKHKHAREGNSWLVNLHVTEMALFHAMEMLEVDRCVSRINMTHGLAIVTEHVVTECHLFRLCKDWDSVYRLNPFPILYHSSHVQRSLFPPSPGSGRWRFKFVLWRPLGFVHDLKIAVCGSFGFGGVGCFARSQGKYKVFRCFLL